MSIDRRTFLRRSALTAGGAAVALSPSAQAQRRSTGFGVPREDAMGLIDLPPGFRYRVLQTIDDQLTNGAPVPEDFDAMWAFAGRQRGTTVLVRNHEINLGDVSRGKSPVPQRNPSTPGWGAARPRSCSAGATTGC